MMTRPIDSLLIHTCNVYRFTKQRNKIGGWNEDWYKSHEIKCRVSTKYSKNSEKQDEMQQSFEPDVIIFTKGNENIKEDDRIKIRDDIYEVKEIKNPSYLDHHLELFCNKLSNNKLGDMNG